jgi:hypothetical protein
MGLLVLHKSLTAYLGYNSAEEFHQQFCVANVDDTLDKWVSGWSLEQLKRS